MKARLLIAYIIGFVCLAGCQNMAVPLTNAQTDIVVQRAMSYPTKNLNPDYLLSDQYYAKECTQALFDLGIFLSQDNIGACEDKWHQILAQEDQQRRATTIQEQQARQKALQEVQQKILNHRVAEIRAGRASIQTVQEAKVIYHAVDGYSLMTNPLFHPDNHYYIVSGTIDPSGGIRSNGFIIKANLSGFQMLGFAPAPDYPPYAYIILKNESDIPKNTHIGSSISVVGIYTDNRGYTAMDGTKHIMPVFTSVFIQGSSTP